MRTAAPTLHMGASWGARMNDEFAERAKRLEKCRAAAATHLMDALIADGATPQSAARAIEAIGEHLCIVDESGVYGPTPEIRRIALAVAELNAALSASGAVARAWLPELLKASGVPDGGEALFRAIPTVRAALAGWDSPSAGRPPLKMLEDAIDASARAWREATGKWPRATVAKDDTGATSPLYKAYCREAGYPVSKEAFQAGLRAAKRTWAELYAK